MHSLNLQSRETTHKRAIVAIIDKTKFSYLDKSSILAFNSEYKSA